MRVALLGVTPVPYAFGGMDRYYEGLHKAINDYGYNCELIMIPVSDKTYEDILKGYLDFYELDLSKFDVVVSSKAPSFMVRHKYHISYLNHRHRQFYDTYEYRHEEHEKFRNIIFKLDNWALSSPNCKRRFCIGETVKEREQKWGGFEPEILYHPTAKLDFHEGNFEYFLAVSRLNDHKRMDIPIKAMKNFKGDIKLKVVGTGPEEEKLKKLAGNDKRIEFLGSVSDKELVELYANALGVIFTPVKEDMGLITIEAFNSSKPVITLSDSGEPAVIVNKSGGGFVANTIPQITEKMEYIFNRPELAESMGKSGKAFSDSITWENIVKNLFDGVEREI